MFTTTLAGNLLLILLGILIVFHILILFKKIPHDIIWAGKIQSREQLIQLELISIAVSLLMATFVALKMGYIDWIQNPVAINVSMWVLFAFFSFNTLGNLTAKTFFEKYVFGTMTLIMALLSLYLALH
jgi:uncharacterized membrane protein